MNIPGQLVVVGPGGLEGNNDAQQWWVCWLVYNLLPMALGSRRCGIYPLQFMSDSDQPNNFCPFVNDHVDGTNPAFQGIAVSPVQVDFGGGTIKAYTHGGGTYDSSINQYRDVIQTPSSFTSMPWKVGVRYDVFIERVYNPDPAVGYVRLWVGDHSTGKVTKLADGHASTFYNQDTGPLVQYGPGFYTKGTPDEGAQPHGAQSTFKLKIWAPIEGSTWPETLAAQPAVFDHARGANKKPVFTITPCETIDSATLLVPAEIAPPPPPPPPPPPVDPYAAVKADVNKFRKGSPNIAAAFDDLLKVLDP